MAGFKNEGFSGRVSEVTTNNNLTVNLTTDKSQMGYVGIGSIVDATRGLKRSGMVTVNDRLLSSTDTPLFQDIFNYTAQNTAIWNVAASGAVVTWGTGGYAVLNSGNATGATNIVMSTWKYFPIYDGGGLSTEFEIIFPQATTATTTLEFGLFQATGIASPTDGVFFRSTNNILYGVSNVAGVETTVNLGYTPTLNTSTTYELKLDDDSAEFWVNQTLTGIIDVNLTTGSSIMSSFYQPITIRTIGSSSVVSSLKIGDVRVTLLDLLATRPWAYFNAGIGGMGSQSQIGGTTGTTAYFTADMAPTAGIVLSNTTQTTYIGLGGQFSIQPTLAVNNDGLLCIYQVPAASTSSFSKSLIITGVRVQGLVTTALTNATTVQLVYSLAYGSTGFSLATAEAAGGTATTKAFRRVPLGYELYPVNAPVGTIGSTAGVASTLTTVVTKPIMVPFLAPIQVSPGEVVGIAVKNVGVVTTLGVITILVTFDSYWE
jgi:hypothetical protein